MKRFLPLVLAVLAGSGLAAFVAPTAGCGCAPPPPRTASEATVRALDVLCVTPPGRDVSMAHGFEYWGTFSEFEGADGALEVRPGRPCGLIYSGTEDGARAVIMAIEQWADGRRMESPAAVWLNKGSRYGAGSIEWRIIPSAAADAGLVEIDYWPESI